MKNIIRNIFISGMAAMTLISCDLNLVPTGSIVYDESKPLFLTENDIASFQNGVLTSYRSVQYGAYNYVSEIMGDGFNAVIGYGNNYGIIHKADDTFTPSNQEIEGVWGSHYTVIKHYNIAIANAEDVAEELKPSADILKAVALFCRASSYLTLARHWGPVYNKATAATDPCVPLVTVYDQLAVPTRASVQSVYNQIYQDLKDAEAIFTAAHEAGMSALIAGVPHNYSGNVRSNIPTLDAVHALMARYYLDIQDYENALLYADKVIKSEAGYKLSSQPADMRAEYTKEMGTEPIIQLYASKAEGLKGNTYYTLCGMDDNTKYFSPYYIPTKKLIDAYDRKDYRLSTWFCLTEAVDTKEALTPDVSPVYPIKVEGSTYGGVYVFQKYRGNPTFITGDVENGAHSAKTIMIGEMYLIAAEAAYYSGSHAAEAKQYLNTLQKARNASTTEVTEATIKNEWFKETVGEGLRFSCVKRWGDGFSKRTPQDAAQNLVMSGVGFTDREISADSYIFNWPIPTYEIQITPNLGQNLGYVSE